MEPSHIRNRESFHAYHPPSGTRIDKTGASAPNLLGELLAQGIDGGDELVALLIEGHR